MKRIIDRFDTYMQLRNLNDNKVTVDCGLSVGLIAKARQGKSDLGKKAIEKILSFYQDINRIWLITGEGEMLVSEEVHVKNEENPNVIVKFIEEISAQRRVTEKAQEQIDRLIKIIEKQTIQ